MKQRLKKLTKSDLKRLSNYDLIIFISEPMQYIKDANPGIPLEQCRVIEFQLVRKKEPSLRTEQR